MRKKSQSWPFGFAAKHCDPGRARQRDCSPETDLAESRRNLCLEARDADWGHGGAEDGLQGLGRQERGAAALTCAFCQRLRVQMHLPPTLHSVGRTRIKKAVGTPNSWAVTHSKTLKLK